jgi:anti-sigma factor RsiW
MDCKRAQDLMLEAAGAPGAELEEHLGGCAECARKALALRQTMALLDEWQAPEPSPYFDVRLRARVREEAARPPAGWWAWLRKPAAGLATAALVVAALGLFNVPGADLDPLQTGTAQVAQAQRIAERMRHVDEAPASAVADLQALERNHELFAHFDLLDDMFDDDWGEF